MDNTEQFNCISLCTGYAGLELGLKRCIHNLRTVVYVEIEAFACTNLVAKIEQGKLDAAPIWTDIKSFDGRPFRDRVHIITGGFPCQPFSVAGQRKGTDDPRHLWPHIERIIQAVRPVWCFFENVSGHLTIGYPEVYRSLRLMGYSVEAGLFTAAEIGAPHKRERLFILAHSNTGRQPQQEGCKRKQRGRIINSSKELDKPESTKRRRMSEEHAGRGIEEVGRPDGSGLADSDSTRRKEQCGTKPIRQEHTALECSRWPSRPGQPQYDWEEPRVIMGNAKRLKDIDKRGSGVRTGQETEEERQADKHKFDRPSPEPRVVDDSRIKKSTRLSSNERKAVSEAGKTGKGQTKPRLGRATSRTRSRVDRLRLLGNGVVPQCAELAFRTLIRMFE